MLELRLLGGHEQHGGDRGVLVSMGVDELAVLPHGQADLHAQGLAVTVDDLAVELVEDERLHVVARHIHGLDPVDDDAPASRAQMEVDEGPHGVQRVVVLRLPVPVELEPAVRRRHLIVAQLARPGQRVAIARGHLAGRRKGSGHGRHGVPPALERPIVEPGCVLVMLLGVAASSCRRGCRGRPPPPRPRGRR